MWHGSFLTDSRKWYLDAQHYFLNVIYFICDSLRHVTWLVLDWFSYVISRRAALLFLCDILHSWLTQTRDMTPPLDWFSYMISRRAVLFFTWYTSFVTHSDTWDDSFLTDSRMWYLDTQHSFFMWYTSSMTHPYTWDDSFLTPSRMWYLDAHYRFFYVIYFIRDSLRHVR